MDSSSSARPHLRHHHQRHHDEQLLVEEKLSARTLILNRPKQLNALSYPMVTQLLELFLAYEKDPSVELIVVKGNGRAFCAGGDVAAVIHYIYEGNKRLARGFFWTEYIMNYLIATYTKPQVSILNGIVMGGGAGVSIHGQFRIATENSVFAMPETSLGLFPDVGASYFLSRLPGFFGEYVGLTGARLDGAEMLACGLATHFVPSMRIPLLEQALYKLSSSDPATISAVIDQYAQLPNLKDQSAYHRLDVIDRCFSCRTIEEILSALDGEAVNGTDDWITATIQSMKKASPMSLKISLRLIREGRLQGIGQCLVSEYRMVCHVMQGKLSKDFFEGCRAILLDKDRNPKWEPSKLELVTNSMVEHYFKRLDDKEWEDLKLPGRLKLPGYAISKI
uniref:3-hydroxyisobutyryl-CoA hydrolase n=3 Tax=Rhizophora mucronata TaxID=61149 RepID=A0A2P2M4E4_RHIMU